MVDVVHGIKHAHGDVWDRQYARAKASPGWRQDMKAFLSSSNGDNAGYGCQMGRAFMEMTGAIEGV